MAALETPSRIWRRIEAVEGKDMPSLPSLPHLDDSTHEEDQDQHESFNVSLPMTSTPAALSYHTATSTVLDPSCTSSGTRFAMSLASRSARFTSSKNSTASRKTNDLDYQSFEISEIQPLPSLHDDVQDLSEDDMELSKETVPEIHIPPDEEDVEGIEEAGEIELSQRISAQKSYDYSVSLRSEPKPSPLNAYRNVALRKHTGRTRTPSLTRTNSSPSSSSSSSTPHSIKSTPIPSPHQASPGPATPSLPHSPAALLDEEPEIGDMESLIESDPEIQEQSYHLAPERELTTIEEETNSRSFSDAPGFPAFPAEARLSSEHGSPILSTTAPVFSPAPSTAFTPTPAARTQLAVPPSFHQESVESETTVRQPDGEDPLVTPHSRRRSFLLDVINSSARPRMKIPTPYPRRSDATPKAGPGTPSPFAIDASRRTSSHPLTQMYVPSEPSESGAEDGGAVSASESAQGVVRSERTTSFVSTASSHDLTTHPRINTSFDPVLGMGGGHGVGRFNAAKLNAYLHGLNRRLQEENEALLDRLRKLESGGASPANGSGALTTRDDLGDLKERWVEEKVELEERMAELAHERDGYLHEKTNAERDLEDERAARARDQDRWKERMTEVEQGVEAIVQDLEEKAAESERRVANAKAEAERRVADAELERAEAIERAQKAEAILENRRDLGGELRAANDRVEKVMGDLKNANHLVRELQGEVARSDGRIEELEKQLKEAGECEEEALGRIEDLQQQLSLMEKTAKAADEQYQKTKDCVVELEEDAAAAVERIESLETQLTATQEEIDRMDLNATQATEKMDGLEKETRRANERVRQLEDALDQASAQVHENDEEIAQLRARTASRGREQEKSQVQQGGSTDAEIYALEDELDFANKEIARLHALLSQSPARKAIEKSKDAKIEMLEREREDLMESIKALRSTVKEMGTPSKLANTSGLSPTGRHALSIKMPITPGATLRDMSWLNNSATDPTVAPLVVEISRLQRELDRANESIDDKLDKLEEAGLGVVGLTKKLEDARTRIAALEQEISRLSRKEDRRVRRLARLRCRKCHIKIDLDSDHNLDESSADMPTQDSLPLEPPTPPTKSSEALKTHLKFLNVQLDALKAQSSQEKHKLEAEKAVLQDATHRLNLKVSKAEDEAKRNAESERVAEKRRAGVEGELDQAKRTITELESHLKEERSRLRSMVAEQHKVQREKEDILLQMGEMEADMDDVKQELQNLKHENHNLEAELRANANADQKARLLESKVAANVGTINQLREERSILSKAHKNLQLRLAETTEHANRIRDQHTASQASHKSRRQQLDAYLGEIEELRCALSNQADELQRTEEEKARIAAEKTGVAQAVEVLEADLKRVKRDAEVFGRDLKLLRAEKERLEIARKEESTNAERTRKQAQAQVRLLSQQLEDHRDKLKMAEEELQRRVDLIDDKQLRAMKLRHNQECKGLMVQIRYLKAKYTRESSLRCMVVAQKDYVVSLLACFEQSERNILISMLRIGFPAPLPPPPPKRKCSLKAVAMCVLFTVYAKRASQAWNEHRASKEAVVAALHDVRKRRGAS